MSTVLLVHGGLWDGVDAEFFWHRPGVTSALGDRGFAVLAPDRLARAAGWDSEAEHLARQLDEPATVVAGSNGCSAAARLAVGRPDLVERLVLAWPTTANDPEVDAYTREGLAGLGASPGVADAPAERGDPARDQ
ncbi:hypothetical protein [Actinophytocola sp.]|uniref:hypothetical protein n=1 Tax=Actinophytocola sp. TaxID=1872138 RepID=UPI003D6A6366